MTKEEIQRAKTLSSAVASIGKAPKPIVCPFSSYSSSPEKQFIFETPESIAGKLNSLPAGSLGHHLIKEPLTAKDVIDALRKLEGNDRLDISNIRNGENLARSAQRQNFDMNDQRWHGGGGSSTGTPVTGEVVAGLGTTFTLAFTPKAGTLALYGQGQRLYLSTDYTISGAVITTVDSWLAKQILADYSH